MPRNLDNPGKGNAGGNGKTKNQTADTNSEMTDGALTGTAGDDHLFGTDGDDTMFGLDGDDTLNGGTGLNRMDGGEGGDTYAVYGRGSVSIVKDSGSDADTDIILAGTSSTTIGLTDFSPESGVEIVSGGGHGGVAIAGTTEVIGIDYINGWHGDDTIVGSTGDDLIYGADGNDFISGGGGSDTLVGNDGADTFFLAADDDGADEIRDFSAAEGDSVDLSDYAGTDGVTGWSLSDRTPDNGVDDPILALLYENGTSKDLAVMYGVTAEDMAEEEFNDNFILF